MYQFRCHGYFSNISLFHCLQSLQFSLHLLWVLVIFPDDIKDSTCLSIHKMIHVYWVQPFFPLCILSTLVHNTSLYFLALFSIHLSLRYVHAVFFVYNWCIFAFRGILDLKFQVVHSPMDWSMNGLFGKVWEKSTTRKKFQLHAIYI